MSEKNNKPKIIIILGPTASGKSDIAVKLALRLRSGKSKKFGGEVISADSRQVYKGLDIGTGKITKKEMRGVKHHLLDVVSFSRLKSGQTKQFTASEFVNLTILTIVKIVKNGKLPIICGGTGFYIDAFLGEKQIPEVPPNLKLRKKLEKKSVSELFEIIQKLDPERAKNIDAKNPRRLIRAIEICKALGSVPKLEIQNPKSEIRNKFKIIKIGIKPEEAELKEKINKRIDKWFKQGLLKEVKNLHEKGLSWKRMGEIGLEYKLVANYYNTPKKTRGALGTSQLKEKMREKTWQYVRRQNTWFKRDQNIHWFKPDQYSEIQKSVENFLRLE